MSAFTYRATNTQTTLYTLTGYAQGTSYSIQYLGQSKLIAQHEIDSIFNVLDFNFSLYATNSLIKDFNQSAKGIKVSPHLRKVITEAKMIQLQTNGAFDIAILNLLNLWGKGSKNIEVLPSPAEIKQTLLYSGSQWIDIHQDSLVKSYPTVAIDCDGIAQGYSVDVLASFLDSKMIADYLVEIGGEVKCKGKNAAGKPWRISYFTASSSQNGILYPPTLHLSGWACTTSGRLNKYTGSKTKKISHIINPQSGMPVDNGIVSVTVIAKQAMTADAYDNALMVLGIEKALSLLENTRELGVHFVYESSPGHFKDTANAFFKLFTAE
jgi:FAD:protein FMN transferase